jgi:iron(III) transport system permease protein
VSGRRDGLLRRVVCALLRAGPLLAEGLVLAFLGAFLLLPIGLAVGSAFVEQGRLSLYWLSRTLGAAVIVRYLLNGLLLACCTTLLALALALPPAVLRARCRFRGDGVLGALLLLPMILPPFVGALSMRHLFSRFGAFNLLLERIGLLDFSEALPPDWLGAGFAGVVVLQALHLFPILYLNASAAMANIDPAYPQAARNLGAGPVRTFLRVTLPLMRPGLFAGGTIVFIWSLTDIGTPLIIGYHRLAPVMVFKELGAAESTPRTYSLVFILLSGSVSLYALGKFLFGRSLAGEMTKASAAAERRRLGGLGTLGAWVVLGTIVFASVLPHIGVVLTAVSERWVNTVLPSAWTLDHLRFVLARAGTRIAVTNSLTYAGLSTVVDLVLGCTAAWLIVRTRVPGRTLVDGLSMMPLAVPGLILAAGYVALTASGPLEPFGPEGSPVLILVIAYAVRRLPFMVRGVSAGLQQLPETLVEAGRNLGASKLSAAARITLPLIAANVIAGAVLTFAFAMLEVSDSLILAQTPKYYPITKEIYTQAVSGNPGAANIASALGVYGMLLLGGTLAVATGLLGRRLGAIFRA